MSLCNNNTIKQYKHNIQLKRLYLKANTGDTISQSGELFAETERLVTGGIFTQNERDVT